MPISFLWISAVADSCCTVAQDPAPENDPSRGSRASPTEDTFKQRQSENSRIIPTRAQAECRGLASRRPARSPTAWQVEVTSVLEALTSPPHPVIACQISRFRSWGTPLAPRDPLLPG